MEKGNVAGTAREATGVKVATGSGAAAGGGGGAIVGGGKPGGAPGPAPGTGPGKGTPGGDPAPVGGQGSGGSPADQSGPVERPYEPFYGDSSGLAPEPGTPDGGRTGAEPAPGAPQSSGSSQADQRGPGGGAATEQPYGNRWRSLPEQESEFPDGSKLRLDGEGGAEYREGDRAARLEGDRWVDPATGEPASKAFSEKAGSRVRDVEENLRTNPPR